MARGRGVGPRLTNKPTRPRGGPASQAAAREAASPAQPAPSATERALPANAPPSSPGAEEDNGGGGGGGG